MRRKSKNHYSNNSRGRVFPTSNPNRRLPLERVTRSPSYLQKLEDRRTFHPEKNYRPLSHVRNAAKLIAVDRTYSNNKRPIPSHTKARIAFADPKRIALCIRRQKRKEVLHALNKTGKIGQKKPQRNEYSSISCKV